MDDDGFYMAEIDGVKGLVPSNFLTEANDQYSSTGQSSQGKYGKVLDANLSRSQRCEEIEMLSLLS